MKIERIPGAAIQVAAYNPRLDLAEGDAEYAALRGSMARWGQVEPLVWNRRTGNLVGGHQRFKILVAGGETEFDCSVVDLPLEEEKALNVALNKIAGDWDKPKLFDLLSDLSAASVDVAATGFDGDELALLAHEIEEAARLFTPTLQPEMDDSVSLRPVRQKDVESAEAEKDKKFKTTRVRDITCPYCAQVFGVLESLVK